MEFPKRMGRVDVLKCDDLSASRVLKLRNRVNRLMSRKPIRVVVDMASAKRMDVAGVGILVERLLRVREQKGDIKLCRIRPELSRLLDRVGVKTLFETFSSCEEALASFKGF